MAMLSLRSAWAKFPVFVKDGFFLSQKVFILAFSFEIRNQRLKIDPCAKFQPDWANDKGSSNFDLGTNNFVRIICLALSFDFNFKIC